MKFETKAVHSGASADPKTGSSALPIFQTASFTYEDPEALEAVFSGKRFGHVYSRISNPTVTAFEQKMAALENGLGSIGFTSGMAAIQAAALGLAQHGDEILSSGSLFGGTYYFFEDLRRLGISTVYANPLDISTFASQITDKTRFIFVECIGNPKVDVPNIPELAALAKKHNIPLVVDATLVSPYLFDAKAAGVSLVLHSATKYIGLGGTTLGGVLTDTGLFDWKNGKSQTIAEFAAKAGAYAFIAKVKKMLVTNAGTGLSPFNAYLLHLGLETLSLRMDRHCDNALALASFLESHKAVVHVNYPGLASHAGHVTAKAHYKGKFGALLTIRLGTKDRCFSFIRGLKVAKDQANLGDSKTLVIHPESTIYRDCTPEQQASAGVYSDLIRVSVGLEHIDDLIADFESALKGN